MYHESTFNLSHDSSHEPWICFVVRAECENYPKKVKTVIKEFPSTVMNVGSTMAFKDDQWRRGSQGRGLSHTKIQFYKNISLVMRNSCWVTPVVRKNLKKPTRSWLVRLFLRPTPPANEKNQPLSVPSPPLAPADHVSESSLSHCFWRILRSRDRYSIDFTMRIEDQRSKI